MKRFDYRRKYTNWTKEQMEEHLPILQDKLLLNLGICDDLADDYSRRISYLKSKIEKYV